MKNVLVLGGSGFIGTWLAKELVKQGVPVQIGDVRQSQAFASLWHSCDIRDHWTIGRLCQNTDSIINLAAEHRDDVRPVSRYRETNVEGASQVCRAARAAGIQRIVFTSSVAVYGFHPYPVDEEGPFAPFNPYGETKLEAEKVYRAWAQEDPSRTLVIVRPTVVFGEGNRGNVYNLLRQISAGRFVMVGSGANVKSIAYVGNAAAFLVHTLSLGSGVHTFNYVDGPDMDMNTLVGHMNRYLGKLGRPPRIPRSLAIAGGHLLDGIARLTGREFPISAVRVRKFCESTQFRADRVARSGFTPPYSLLEGLARTIEYDFPR